jgi:hypothetical protein
MKIKNTIFLLILTFSTHFISAQNVKLTISNLEVNIKDQKFEGNPFTVQMKVNRRTDRISIFKSNETEIKASYKLLKFGGVRRSNLKKTSLQLDIKYYFYYKGKKVKKNVQKDLYVNNDRQFEENEKAIFMRGISNTVITITYKGVLPE